MTCIVPPKTPERTLDLLGPLLREMHAAVDRGIDADASYAAEHGTLPWRPTPPRPAQPMRMTVSLQDFVAAGVSPPGPWNRGVCDQHERIVHRCDAVPIRRDLPGRASLAKGPAR